MIFGVEGKHIDHCFLYLCVSQSVSCFFFKNGPTPASFLFIFVLFNNNFTEKL